ncbi:MAG TPA: TauD/TfdA family dioxygenase, partial [Burkholderiaceae bacterium]|nr:TauD/TfdA family dioxygenase [Burkholderiaceae bacterium]
FKHFTVEPVTPAIGAIVHGLHLSDVSEAAAAELREALWHYGVLFAREQHLSFDQHKALGRHFGDELERHTFGRTMAEQGHPEVLIIQKSKSAGNGTTTDVWHHDVTGRANPNIMSILQAEEVPFGADTMWASMSAAFERLPYALKLMFLNLDIDHDTLYGAMRHDQGRSAAFAQKVLEQKESHTHPAVVHHHATGRLCLFVGNAWVKRVHGLPADQGELILRIANDMSRLPEIQVRWQWRKGDVAMWDNFGTSHYGVSGDVSTQTRRLYRVAAWSPKVRPTLDRQRAMQELMGDLQ